VRAAQAAHAACGHWHARGACHNGARTWRGNSDAAATRALAQVAKNGLL
jgi:hypothetical protein